MLIAFELHADHDAAMTITVLSGNFSRGIKSTAITVSPLSRYHVTDAVACARILADLYYGVIMVF